MIQTFPRNNRRLRDMFRVTVFTENDAFTHSDELARVLRGLARKVDDLPAESFSGTLKDINGNFCGTYEYREENNE